MLDAADHQMAETLENAENHKEQIANIAVHTYEVCGLNRASVFFFISGQGTTTSKD